MSEFLFSTPDDMELYQDQLRVTVADDGTVTVEALTFLGWLPCERVTLGYNIKVDE